MTEQEAIGMAAQLRQPHGEHAVAVGEMMNKGNANMNLKTLEAVAAQANDAILEIGMGNGYFVKDILSIDDSVHYTGCDFSEVMIAEAQRLNAEWINKGQARFVFGDIASLPFADDSFNKVFTVNTIYFWPDAPQALSELKRVLRPGGKLFFALRPKRQMMNYPFTKHGFIMFSKEDVSELLRANGFEVVSVQENNEPDFIVGDVSMKVEHMIVEAVIK
jgi:ubiquinone/menaquinone biosynthesis C-methylase UbiE